MSVRRKLRLTAAMLGAAALFSAAYTAFPAEASTADTTTIDWLLTNTETPTNSTASWPQSILTAADCGWTQRDVWDTSTPAMRAEVDRIMADGILTEGEDYGVIVSWEFIYVPCESGRINAAVDQSAAKDAGELAATGGGYPFWVFIPCAFIGITAGFFMARGRRS